MALRDPFDAIPQQHPQMSGARHRSQDDKDEKDNKDEKDKKDNNN